MQIFGLDPGSRYTGYGIVSWEDGRLQHVASGRINLTGASTFSGRLHLLYESMGSLLTLHPCDGAAIEKLYVGRNVQSTIKLSHARGVALLAIEAAGTPITEYSPSEIKQAVAGHGHADKQQVSYMVGTILGLATSSLSEDATDALAMAICHLRAVNFNQRLRR